MRRTNKRRERFQSIYQATEPFQVAKKNTIHALAGVGRKHKILRYPILVGLVAFVFLYNLFLYIFMELKMEEKLAKGMAVLMTGVLVITSIDLTALAMTPKEEDYYRVTALEEIDSPVVVPYGTELDELELPESVSVTMDRYTFEEVEQEIIDPSMEESVEESIEESDEEIPSEEESGEDIPDEEESGIEESVVEPPVEEESVVEPPVEEDPVVEPPVVESPNEEPPVVEEPIVETPAPAAEPAPVAETPAPEAEPVVTSETVVVEPEVINAEPEVAVETGILTEEEKPEVKPQDEPEEDPATTNIPVVTNATTVHTETVIEEKVVETITVDLPVTWECEDYDSKTPGQYTFTAKLPKEFDDCSLIFDDVTIPTVIVEVLEAEALTLSEIVDGIEITMVAAPGVFPADASLSVTKIDDAESIAKIEEAIQNTLDKTVENDEETTATLKKTITFDVVVLDKDGQEIQPEIPEGMSAQQAVTVTFKKVVPKLETELTEEEKEAEAEQSMEVFYVDDSMNSATQVESQVEGEDLSFSPEHFSYYTCSCYVSSAKGIYDWKSLYKAVYSKDGTVNIRLRDDITIQKLTFYSNSDRLLIKNGQEVNIDLNGHQLIGNVSGKPAIEVKDGTLNIHDYATGAGTISSRKGSYVIYANGRYATVNLTGGSIVKSGSESYGIYVTNNATVNIQGGYISGSFPYGIYFNSSYRESGTMSGGYIDGASYGVYIGGSTNRGTTFTMTGGTIWNSTSVGIYNNSGSVTMTGGTISGNSGYKVYGIMNTGSSNYLKLGGAVTFSSNRAADIYVGSSNYINLQSALTGSSIGVATGMTPTTDGARFTYNVVNETTMKKFYSAANSSYAVWKDLDQSYYVVGPKDNCKIRVKPQNIKVNPNPEDMAGTVAIGTGAASTTEINTTVKYNATVTLTATLINAEEYEFTGWKDKDTNSIVESSPVFTFTATNDKEYTAVFTKKKVSITVEAPLTNGIRRGTAYITGYSLNSGWSRATSGTFEVGSTITISASPSSSEFQFSQWNDGNKVAEGREVTVKENTTYSAQFRLPPPSATATGVLYVNVKKVTADNQIPSGANILLLFGNATMQESGNNVGVAGLPPNSAILKEDSNNAGHYSDYWNKKVLDSQSEAAGVKDIYPGTLSDTTPGTKVDVKKAGNGFDTCEEGLIRYYDGSWYYWCDAGGKKGIGKYSAYTYSKDATFTAGSIQASLNKLKLRNESTVENVDLTIEVTASDGNVYKLENMIFQDATIDYKSGKRMVELNLGGVKYTYVLPEAIVTDENDKKIKEYNSSLQEAIGAAQTGQKVHVVGPAVSEIRGTTVSVKPGVTICSYDGSTITTGGTEAKVFVDADGTIKLVSGTITVTPPASSTGGNETVKVGVQYEIVSEKDGIVTVTKKDGIVTAKEPITVTADENGQNSYITTTKDTPEIVISPDGDPTHTVTYEKCEGGNTYGIHGGELTNEDKVTITAGTEYDLTVKLGDGQTTNIETDSSNPGTTTITKGKGDDNQPDGSIVIESDKPNNDITVGDTKYTTSDDETKLVIKPGTGSGSEGGEGEEGGTGATGKPEVVLEKGSVQLPPEGTVTLPNGDKVTNSTNPEEGSESVTVSDDNKVRVPAGAEATLGDGDDAIKVSVPKGENGEPDSLPAEITPNKDGDGYEVKAEPGNDVKIGDETYRIGDYDTSFEVKPGTGEDGKPDIVVTDGGVELKPGQSITDSNGTKFTNTGDKPIKLSMTEGEDTEVTLGEGDKFTYQQEGEEPQEFKNPGSSDANFSVSKDGEGVSLNSDMDVPKGKEVDVDFLGNKVTIEVPEGNTGDVKIDPTEGTVTIGKSGDKVIIDGKEYTASEADTVLKPGQDGVELKEGGVSLDPSDSIVTGGTKISNSGDGEDPVNVKVDEDGQTTVKVPENGGFTMTDPNSGESVSFKNPSSGSQDYSMDDGGSLVLPNDSEISYTQGEGANQKTTTIGSTGEQGVTLRPTENGVEITAPSGSNIKVDNVTYPNASEGEDLVLAVDPATGKPVLESGMTSIPQGEEITLPGGDTVKNESGSNTIDSEGNIGLPNSGDKVTIERDGKKNSYTAAGEDTKIAYDPEKGIPTLTEGSVKLDKDSAIDVVYNTVNHEGAGEGNDKDADYTEDLKATIKSTGEVPPTVNADGTVAVPKSGAVDIDSEVATGSGESAESKKAHNTVAVPQGAHNETVSVKPNTDGSADITLNDSGDRVTVNGMEYTAREDDTQITITETGSTLKQGAVDLDGGKNPQEGINVNGTCVTNSGAKDSTVSVKKNDDGTTDFTVSEGGAFDLSVPGQPDTAVTFKNPGDTDGTYKVKTDGSIDIEEGSSLSFETTAGDKTISVPQKEGEGSEEGSKNKVTLNITEDGVELTAPQGSGIILDETTYTNAGGEDEDLVITVGSDGTPTLDKGKTTISDGGKIKLPNDGPVITTGKDDNITVDDNGNVDIPEDAIVEIQTPDGKKNTYTATEEGTRVSYDPDDPETRVPELESGSVTLGKGSSIKADEAVYTSTGTNPPTIKIPTSESEQIDTKPLVTLPENSAVTIDSSVPGTGGNPVSIKTTVSVPAGSDEVQLSTNTDGVDIKLGESGNKVNVNGVEFETTKDNTEIKVTDKGSTLEQGGVSLDGGKNPKEGINVNDTCITNSGANGSKVTVEKNDDGTVGMTVSAGGSFDLSVPGVPNSAVTFMNLGTEDGTYTINEDGSITLGSENSEEGTSTLQFKTASGQTVKVTGDDKVSMKVTELGVELTVERGEKVTINGVEYEADTFSSDPDKQTKLTVDNKGNVIITDGAAKVPQGQPVYVTNENNELIKIQKTAVQDSSQEIDTITVSSEGRIDAKPGDTLTIGDGTYTCKDTAGEFDLILDPKTGEIEVENGAEIDVTNGNLTFVDAEHGNVAVSTTGNKTIQVKKSSTDEKPIVTIPSGGNAAIDNGADGSAVEIKVPAGTTEKEVTIDEEGNITVELEADEKITIGGIVYTADQGGAIKVDAATGALKENTAVDSSEETPITVIDPTSFNKENYEYQVKPGESVQVGNVTYTAPEGGMTLKGNSNGNPIIEINKKGESVEVGNQTYTAGSDGTQFVVNGTNNVTLVDNGNGSSNSSLKVDGSGTMIIDGNTIVSSGAEEAGYTITKTTSGEDALNITDGTRVSVNMGANGTPVNIPGKLSYNGQTTGDSGMTIQPPASGTTGVILDKTTQDASGNYVTKLSASGSTILTPVLDENGNMIGFTTSVQIPKPQPKPDPNPGTGNGENSDSGSNQKPVEQEPVLEEETEEPVEEETTGTRRPVTEEENSDAENTEEAEETVGDSTADTAQDQNTDEETVNTEKPVVTIQTVREGEEIAVWEDMEVVLQDGKINLQVSSEDGSMTGTVEQILMACFSEEEIEQIKSGTTAEVRVAIVRIREDVPKQDEKVMQKTYERYTESIDGLQFGGYVDIMIETRLGDNDWQQVHELNGEVELTLNIPEQLLADGRTYFVMRNHNDKCTILEDLDEDHDTITIATDQFSTYAILYTDSVVENINLAELNQTQSVMPWILFGVFVLLMLAFGVLVERKRRSRRDFR